VDELEKEMWVGDWIIIGLVQNYLIVLNQRSIKQM